MMMMMTNEAQRSFTEPEIQSCPYQFLKQIQLDQPVYRDPVSGFLIVTRAEDCVHVVMHPEIFSSITTVIFDRKDSPVAAEVAKKYSEKGFLPMHTLVTNDPPSHTLYRSLIDRVFNPRFVSGLESHITELADKLIDAFISQDKVDLLREFAIKLPMYIIAGQLGVPQQDWEKFKVWSDATNEQINPTLLPERELEITDLVIEMQQYLYQRAMEYREKPQETLLSRVANTEVEGRLLEPRELISVAHHLLVAGNETTTATLASGILMLLENPDLRARLSANPKLITEFFEEVLRLHPPVKFLYRQALKDTEISGMPVPKNSVVLCSSIASNRDPRSFERADQIEVGRKNLRQHISFGRGIHFCIGSQLARAELRIALERLLARLPNLRLDPDKPKPQYAAKFHTHELDSLFVML